MLKHSLANALSRSTTNIKEKKPESGMNLNINLGLLSNKASIETLMSMAKKQKNAGAKTEIEANQETSPSLYNSVTFTPSTKGAINQDDPYSMSEGAKFMRADRKPIVANSTKLAGKLDIMKKLNSNIDTKSSNNIFLNKNQQGQGLKQAHPLSQFNNEGKRELTSTIAMGQKSLFFTEKKSNSLKETSYDRSSYSIKKANCVLEFAYKEEQNSSYKDTMEDMGKSVDCFNNNINEGLFCLFDGHGGDGASRYLQSHFLAFFKQALNATNGHIELALKLAFKTIDKELEALDMANVGSTGCVIYTVRENSYYTVYTANVGDTRCSLISPMKYARLTVDHRVDVPEERSRIISSGGEIKNDRVMGMLMLTRVFGDFELKPYGVKSEPHLTKTIVDFNHKTQLLVCASDGVWDVLGEDDIKDYIMFNNDTEELCKTIIKYSIAKGSWDNLSCLAIKLT